MRVRSLLALVMFCLLPLTSRGQHARIQLPIIEYGFINTDMQDKLESLWSEDTAETERAYCLPYQDWMVTRNLNPGRRDADILYRVDNYEAARTGGSTQIEVDDIQCNGGSLVPILHTHPGASCTEYRDGRKVPLYCVPKGIAGHQCQPSRLDIALLLIRGAPFDVIQCGPREYRFYFQSEYRERIKAEQS